MGEPGTVAPQDNGLAGVEPPPIARFDGAAAWDALSIGAQRALGALALELAVGRDVEERAYRKDEAVSPVLGRAAATAVAVLMNRFDEAVQEQVPMSAICADDGVTPRIPSELGPICRSCGCSETDACEDGCGWCGWATEARDLCTACVARLT